MSIPGWVRYVLLAWLVVAVGCGPKNAPAGLTIAVPADTIAPAFVLPPRVPGTFSATGTITFEKLGVTRTPDGTPVELVRTVQPLRFVNVGAVDEQSGAIVATGATDATGTFTLAIPEFRPYRIAVFSETTATNGRFNADVRDPANGTLYTILLGQAGTGTSFEGLPPKQTTTLQVATIPIAPVNLRLAAVANILDSVFAASETVRAANGNVSLGPIVVFWSPTDTVGSYYSDHGAINPVTGVTAPAIRLKGGNSDQDDTDEFDDDLINHEYGHFMVSQLSKSSSRGGRHSITESLYPSLAFNEGLADWFSAIVRGNPSYVDAQAITGSSPTAFSFNAEEEGNLLAGIDIESTVFEVFWDLTDGGSENRFNGDGLSGGLTFKQALDGLKILKGSRNFVILQDGLAGVVQTGAISQAAVDALTASQNVSGTGPDLFPEVLSGSGTLDWCRTVTEVLPLTGRDDVNRFFKFDVGVTTNVSITATLLDPGVTGSDADGSNVDMLLLDSNNEILASSRTQGLVENIQRSLPPGRYYVNVTGRPLDAQGKLSNQSSQLLIYQIDRN